LNTENLPGAPLFPIFKTAEPRLDQVDNIYNFLVEDERCLTNDPIFNDFGYGAKEIPRP